MPSLRINPHDQLALAIDDLQAVTGEVSDIAIAPVRDDVVEVEVNGRSWKAHVHAVDALGADDATALTAASRRGAQLVVANAISDDARTVLDSARWSWLDRRLGLHLTHGAVLAVVRFASGSPLIGHGRALATTGGLPSASPASDGPITGRAGISFAAAVLREPERPPSVRRVAAAAGMSPSAMSDAAKRLRNHGLIDGTNHPSVPALFDALAGVWRPERVATVASLPQVDGHARLDLNLADLDSTGWALGGDRAALAWGAPMFTTDAPPWFWVPSQTEARRAERVLGPSTWEARAAVVAVAPTPILCRQRLVAPSDTDGWPTIHPVFVALDLAGDTGRGREVLDSWRPEGITRVW